MKKKWRFKFTIEGKWATIVVESNHFGLGGIIQDAYDNAVKELNKKKIKEVNKMIYKIEIEVEADNMQIAQYYAECALEGLDDKHIPYYYRIIIIEKTKKR